MGRVTRPETVTSLNATLYGMGRSSTATNTAPTQTRGRNQRSPMRRSAQRVPSTTPAISRIRTTTPATMAAVEPSHIPEPAASHTTNSDGTTM